MTIKNQVKQKNTKILVVAIAAFIIAYIGTVGVLTVAYGYDFKNSTAYNETMNITKDAANKTGGLMIEQYVLNIEKQTLGGI